MYGDNNQLCSIHFGTKAQGTTAAVSEKHPSPHVKVVRDGDDVILCACDGEVRWRADDRFWELSWKWHDDAPSQPLGSGIGEYSRARLTPE